MPALDIISFDEMRRLIPGVCRSETALHVTAAALDHAVERVGTRPPESGCIGFGPTDRDGVDVFEFDERGSSRAGSAWYAPDASWGAARQDFWMGRPPADRRVLHGFMHSHPGGNGVPSRAAGPGRGDLGYAAALLAANEWAAAVHLPILTEVGTGRVRLWSWVVTREHPAEARYADVRVSEPASWPPRRFNPEWEASLAPTPKEVAAPPLVYPRPVAVPADLPSVPLLPLDLDEVATLARARLDVTPAGFLFSRPDAVVLVRFPASFPVNAPRLFVARPGEPPLPLRPRWRRVHQHRTELRLGRLLLVALDYARREF